MNKEVEAWEIATRNGRGWYTLSILGYSLKYKLVNHEVVFSIVHVLAALGHKTFPIYFGSRNSLQNPDKCVANWDMFQDWLNQCTYTNGAPEAWLLGRYIQETPCPVTKKNYTESPVITSLGDSPVKVSIFRDVRGILSGSEDKCLTMLAHSYTGMEVREIVRLWNRGASTESIDKKFELLAYQVYNINSKLRVVLSAALLCGFLHAELEEITPKIRKGGRMGSGNGVTQLKQPGDHPKSKETKFSLTDDPATIDDQCLELAELLVKVRKLGWKIDISISNPQN